MAGFASDAKHAKPLRSDVDTVVARTMQAAAGGGSGTPAGQIGPSRVDLRVADVRAGTVGRREGHAHTVPRGVGSEAGAVAG